MRRHRPSQNLQVLENVSVWVNIVSTASFMLFPNSHKLHRYSTLGVQFRPLTKTVQL